MSKLFATTALAFICTIAAMSFAYADEHEAGISKFEVFDKVDNKSDVAVRTDDVPSIDSAVAEIKRLSQLILSKIAASDKELAQSRKQIQHRYTTQLEAVKHAPQDEFETVAQLKVRKEQQAIELAHSRDAELAKLEAGKLLVKEELESYYQSIKKLDEREYVLGAESIASELGRYNADKQRFTVSLHSKTKNVKLAMKGIIPMPVEQAKVFKQQWKAGQVRPEVKARLNSSKVELSLFNYADNTRLTLLGSAFLTPEMLVSEAAAAVLTGEMITIPGKNFEISKTEVTQEQWQAVMGNNPSRFKGEHLPVDTVSWNDVQLFLGKLNQKTGKQYRLPTGSEWRFACYGGKQTDYCGSNDIDAVAWYDTNSGGKTRPVGQKKANAYGLHDMSGNVREWIQDGDKYRRLLLGGAWFSPAEYMRADNSRRYELSYRDYDSGFRLARTLPQ